MGSWTYIMYLHICYICVIYRGQRDYYTGNLCNIILWSHTYNSARTVYTSRTVYWKRFTPSTFIRHTAHYTSCNFFSSVRYKIWCITNATFSLPSSSSRPAMFIAAIFVSISDVDFCRRSSRDFTWHRVVTFSWQSRCTFILHTRHLRPCLVCPVRPDEIVLCALCGIEKLWSHKFFHSTSIFIRLFDSYNIDCSFISYENIILAQTLY